MFINLISSGYFVGIGIYCFVFFLVGQLKLYYGRIANKTFRTGLLILYIIHSGGMIAGILFMGFWQNTK